jgi:hypothetical protein
MHELRAPQKCIQAAHMDHAQLEVWCTHKDPSVFADIYMNATQENPIFG